MSVYDLSDYAFLRQNGWKYREYNTYKSMKKEELIDNIRIIYIGGSYE